MASMEGKFQKAGVLPEDPAVKAIHTQLNPFMISKVPTYDYLDDDVSYTEDTSDSEDDAQKYNE
jgi:hypothetical protein